MWDLFEPIAREINRDDFVKVQARVEIYRNRPQLSLQQVRRRQAGRNRSRRLSCPTPRKTSKSYTPSSSNTPAPSAIPFSTPWSPAIITDPQIAPRYKRAPAAKVMHHAYIGGLIEHVTGLCAMAQRMAAHYPELDVDLLLTVAMLHDVGKLDELCYERAIGYTTEGQLLGHIVMELETVSRAIDAIAAFPPR